MCCSRLLFISYVVYLHKCIDQDAKNLDTYIGNRKVPRYRLVFMNFVSTIHVMPLPKIGLQEVVCDLATYTGETIRRSLIHITHCISFGAATPAP